MTPISPTRPTHHEKYEYLCDHPATYSYLSILNNRITWLVFLNAKQQHNIHTKMKTIKVLIADKSSMIQAKDLAQINARLKHALNTSKDFGNQHVILIGDFYQQQYTYMLKTKNNCNSPNLTLKKIKLRNKSILLTSFQ